MGMVANLYPPEQRGRARSRFARSMRVMMGQMLLPRAHQKGRVPLLEILIGNTSVQRAIRAGEYQVLPALMKRGKGLGMQTVDDALRNLLSRNPITWEEALFHAVDREWLSARLGSKSANR